MGEVRVLVVIPTLGTRIEYLEACLSSIRQQAIPIDVVLVGPQDAPQLTSIVDRWGVARIDDPGGLAAAINAGVAWGGDRYEYINWLGDDDALEPHTVHLVEGALDDDSSAVLAYGACRYVDPEGRELWISRAGRWAPRILKWGPDLIPQPGMLVRSDAWRTVGGLDESFRFAFDLDLLLKLQRVGTFVNVDEVVSEFRWHGDSLTVSDRTTSLHESEIARRRALSPVARKLSWAWERPVRIATRMAAWEVSRRARNAMREATS